MSMVYDGGLLAGDLAFLLVAELRRGKQYFYCYLSHCPYHMPGHLGNACVSFNRSCLVIHMFGYCMRVIYVCSYK